MTQDKPNTAMMELIVKLPTTSELFQKHFNDMGQAGLLHPNTEAFFEELNQVLLIEDALKTITQTYKQ